MDRHYFAIRNLFLAGTVLACGQAAADEVVMTLAPGGAASLVNPSFEHSVVVRSYSIGRLESGADLLPAQWNSFQRQGFSFVESSATVDLLSEVASSGGITIGPGQSRSIGTPFDLRADANGDGIVDLYDFRIVKDNQGQSLIGPAFGDLDYNGIVDADGDFQILLEDFGKSALFTFSVTTAVPEPASVLLAAVALGSILAHRRRPIVLD